MKMNLPLDKNKIDELITGYLTRTLQKLELEELHAWLIASSENKAYFIQMQEVWFSSISSNHRSRFDSEKAFQRFLARTTLQDTNDQQPTTENLNSRNVFLSFRQMTAAVALLFVVAGSAYWFGKNNSSSNLADVSVEAPLGSRTKLHLPDGTLVWLNAGSRISYSQRFGVDDRKVALDGEGYFEVTKNKSLPFNVKTNEMTVRVLGTKFNFRNYEADEEARVTLIEGRVSFNNGLEGMNEQFLNPNQQVVYDKKMKSTTISAVKATRASRWTQGQIFFDEEKLADIANELERCYNVKIHIADQQLNTYRFYGNFARTEQTIQEVLDVLASTNRLAYKINGKEITLMKKQ
jgi:transmembrane sensor